MAEYAVVEVHSSSARDAESQTIEVLASPVDRKLTNDLLKLLSQELPMADVGLEHLKRVRRTSATAEQGDAGAGRLVLTVLLSTRERFRAVSPERLGRFALQPSPVVVPRFAARTRQEYDRDKQLWPSMFHHSTSHAAKFPDLDADERRHCG